MTRLIALLILVIPGAIAAIGVKLMRDTIFNYINSPFTALWQQLLTGFLGFLLGVTFIGGWVFYRDRKRNYVANRFRNNPPRRK